MTFQKIKSKRPEDRTQEAGLQWLALAHPRARQHIVRIMNEGNRSMLGHIIAKRGGLHKGASDLFLAYRSGKYIGLWMEIKPDGWRKPRNKAEEQRVKTQIEFGELMKKQGYQFALCCGVAEMILAFKRYLNADKED